MEDLKRLLDQKSAQYNKPDFIARDPISIPHRFPRKQDIEIAGLFAAILAWGNRSVIIRNAGQIMEWMDGAPYDFVRHHRDTDLKRFLRFVHRTFNATDLLYFISFLQHHYGQFDSLEDAFVPEKKYAYPSTEEALIHFRNYFFSLEHPHRTTKHIATPERNSACKRINMYLRWMVRPKNTGVDFGIWKKITPDKLIIPLDVHVARVAYRLGLTEDERATWKNATALTTALRQFNANDPVVYDFALFGMGIEERL